MPNPNPASTIKSLETTIRIIETLHAWDGAHINELATSLEVAPSTVHRHLSTLRKHDFVTKRGDMYYLGIRFLTIGGYLQNNNPAYRLAEQTVQELAERTNERAQFIIEEHGYRVYVHTAVGENAVQTGSHIGKRGHLHCSAAGKAILAFLPRSYVQAILDERGLTQETTHTITDRETLFEELDAICERNTAFNREESLDGLHAVGTTVRDENGHVIGGLSVSGPAHRLTGERFETEIPELLLGMANELELKIQYE